MSATLTEIDTVEVSLVTRGANRKRFALRKEESVKKPIKTRKMEGADPVKKPLDGLSDAARKAVMDALQMLAAVRDELPPDLLDVVARELGYSGADEIEIQEAGPEDPDREYPAPNPEEPPPMSTENPPIKKTEPTVAQLSPEAKAQIEKAEKDALAATAQSVELKKQLEVANAQSVELAKQIAVEKDARLNRDFIAKAAKLSHLPEKAEVLGPILKELTDKAPEAAAKIEKFLESTNEKLAKVLELTKELGHSHSDGGEQTAWGQIQKAAEDLRKVEGNKLSKEQAIQKAMELNPTLYEQYNREQGARD